MPFRKVSRIVVAPTAVCLLAGAAAQEPPAPLAVRNDVSRAGEELLVLRHQKLRKGGHEAYYRISLDGVWPWFEKIGTRIAGQWKVIHPDGSPESPDYDEGYRLARYAGYEHWKATRRGQYLGGNGPDYRKNQAALKARSHYVLGSDGAYFLQGRTAAVTPDYLPALAEKYESVEAAPAGGARPARNDAAWPAREIVALDRRRIAKGAADSFIAAGAEGIRPYLEKVGVRVIGCWKAVYPPESRSPESPDYDEVFTMARYAGYEHWKAARPEEIVFLGGDGKDYAAYSAAREAQQQMTRERTVVFLEGYFHQSPPFFLPGMRESYRKIE